MRLTNADLRRLYRRYNRKYFKNRLPRIAVFFSKKLRKYNSIGRTHYEGQEPIYIAICSTLRSWSDTAKLTLLHEMAHVKLPYRVNHGPKFQKEMRRLAKSGAFDYLW